MKKKVVEYIGTIKDAGAETLVKDYALLLDKEKFEVVVLCEDYVADSANYRILIKNGIKIVSTYAPNFTLNKILYRILGNKYRASLLRKKLIELKPDVLHIHLEELEDVYRNIDLLKRTKLIYTCHNLPKRMIGEERPKEKKACEYLLKHNNLQIIALHDEMAREINEKFGIKSTKIIRNGVDFKRFKNLTKTKEDVLKELGISNDSFIVGHVGRFTYQKNHEFLINVFNEIVKLKPNSHLLLVGDGKLENDVRNQINSLNLKDKVTIISHRNDIPELMKAMNVFVFPSRWEGLGIVLIEAQVIGLSCVVSDKVPKEAFKSNLINLMSLDDSYENWAKMAISPKNSYKNYGDISSYDMNTEIKQLEKIYLE